MTSGMALLEEPAFAAPALAVLRRRGPLGLAELCDVLARESPAVDEEALRAELETRGDVVEFDDECWGHVPSLADGLVLTHEVSAEELDRGVLTADGDLDLWARLADEGMPFAGGGELRAVYSCHGLPRGAASGLAGPAGWLDGCRPGAVIGLRLTGGSLELLPEPDIDASDSRRSEVGALVYQAIGAAVDALEWYDNDPDAAVVPGAPIDEVLLAVRRQHPGALAVPLLPVSWLLSGFALEVCRGYVGVPGAPWDGEVPWLDDTGQQALRGWRLLLAVHRCFGRVYEGELVDLARAARDPELLALVGGELACEPEREPVVQAMAAAVTGPLMGGPLYLRACAAEGRGDVLAAERLLETAVQADPDLVVALQDLAWYRSDRGDAHGAEQLFRRAETEGTHPVRSVLRGFLRPPEMSGRNRPCACGSGRKYKLCHGAKLRHPFPMRADWLWVKAVCYALRPGQRDVLYRYADPLAGGNGGNGGWLLTALTDPLVHDLALFDGGLLARFLNERGALLPEDEQALARSWLDSRRRLLEVTTVRPGHGVRCRDLLTGQEVYVRDRMLTTQLEPLDLIYCRVLPDGAGELRLRDAPRYVSRLQRGELLELLGGDATGEEVAEFFAPGSGLPRLSNAEGEDLVLCTARYEVAEPDVVWRGLAEQLDDDGGDSLVERAEVRGRGAVLRGSVRRAGDRIELDTNSVERLRRLQALVRQVDPTARLVDESAVPIEEALAERDIAERDGGGEEPARADDLPPEVAAELLAGFMRDYEQHWLDMEIPALGSRTPREAAADPAHRGELAALLDDIEWGQRHREFPGMDAGRLRLALGLLPDRS
jgi:hypothetical protein